MNQGSSKESANRYIAVIRGKAGHLALNNASIFAGIDPMLSLGGAPGYSGGKPKTPPKSDIFQRFPPYRNYSEVADFRRGAQNRPTDIDGTVLDTSRLKPGDRIETDGATILGGPKGEPIVQLRKGYSNGRDAAKSGPVLMPLAPRDVSVAENIHTAKGKSSFWFRRTVPNKGPWDYKQRGREFEAFGNFNYGATGMEVHPLPPGSLRQEAGLAQRRDRTNRPQGSQTDTADRKANWGRPGIRFLPFTGSGSFGDDPIDQYWIEQGMRYHDAK